MLVDSAPPSFENVGIISTVARKNQISILKNEHIKEVAELFTKSFCDEEPLCKHLGIGYDDFMPYALMVVEKAAIDQLSVVALDIEGHVIGCVIGEDIANPSKRDYKPLRPIHLLLNTLSEPFIGKKYKKNSIVHIFVTAVAEKLHGLGLSTILNNACVALALQHGFSYVFAEFTSSVNERFMNRFPEYMKCELKFKDFLLDGKRPFGTLEGIASAYLFTAVPYVRLADVELCLIKE